MMLRIVWLFTVEYGGGGGAAAASEWLVHMMAEYQTEPSTVA